jgi:hypothetical protein
MTRWESDWEQDDGAHRGFVSPHHTRPAGGTRGPDGSVPQVISLNSLAAIWRSASKAGFAPGIVAERLQHERKIPFSRANQVKRRFNFGD